MVSNLIRAEIALHLLQCHESLATAGEDGTFMSFGSTLQPHKLCCCLLTHS